MTALTQTIEDRIIHFNIGLMLLDPDVHKPDSNGVLATLARSLHAEQICEGTFDSITNWTVSLTAYYLHSEFVPNTAGQLIQAVVAVADGYAHAKPDNYRKAAFRQAVPSAIQDAQFDRRNRN